MKELFKKSVFDKEYLIDDGLQTYIEEFMDYLRSALGEIEDYEETKDWYKDILDIIHQAEKLQREIDIAIEKAQKEDVEYEED